MRRKQHLAIALDIQKENRGNQVFFRDHTETSIWKITPYIALYFQFF